MKFEENLRELRKRAGLSQEELADHIDVSRQAVSKWENGSSYPELDKLMILCELFHCTLDDLLQKDLKDKDCVNVEAYIKNKDQMSKMTTIGVTIILLAVTFYCFLDSKFINERENILNAGFMIMVAIAVLIFVYYGMQSAAFKRKYPKAPQQIYNEEEQDHFYKIHRISVVIGIALILIGTATRQVLVLFSTEDMANGTFMLFVTVAVTIFVYYGMQYHKYEETTMLLHKSEENEEITGKICGVIMILATICFIIWGFIWGAWHISWIVYPIAGMLCGIVGTIFHKEHKDE